MLLRFDWSTLAFVGWSHDLCSGALAKTAVAHGDEQLHVTSRDSDIVMVKARRTMLASVDKNVIMMYALVFDWITHL